MDSACAAAYPAAYREGREAFRLSGVAAETWTTWPLSGKALRQAGVWFGASAPCPSRSGFHGLGLWAEDIAEVPGLVPDQNSGETMEQNLRKLKQRATLGTALVEVRTAQVLLPRIDPKVCSRCRPNLPWSGGPPIWFSAVRLWGLLGARQIAESGEDSGGSGWGRA